MAEALLIITFLWGDGRAPTREEHVFPSMQQCREALRDARITYHHAARAATVTMICVPRH